MKVLKVIFGFIIIYFIITAANSMVDLAKWASFGKSEIEYLIYLFFFVLFCIYVIFPLLKYYKKPSLTQLEEYLKKDRYKRKIERYLLKILSDENLKEYENKDPATKKIWLKEYFIHQADSFDKIIKKYAQQATVTVMISPNSFIDGIAILFSNSKMIYVLSKKVGFRYNFSDLIKMYFSVLTAASITGLVEEFDEVIEDIIEDIAEEFSEAIAEETGKTIGGSVPVVKILVGSLSPILQAAGNYAFMLYSGYRFKYSLLSVVEDEKLSEKEIKKKARKRARLMKYLYIKDMSSNVVSGSSKKITERVISGARKINVFSKKSKSE